VELLARWSCLQGFGVGLLADIYGAVSKCFRVGLLARVWGWTAVATSLLAGGAGAAESSTSSQTPSQLGEGGGMFYGGGAIDTGL
jgi:hypothetical protein